VTVNDVIAVVEDVSGRPINLVRHDGALGDVRRTGGCADLIGDALGWSAETALEDGIRAQDAEYRQRSELAEAFV
jgi:hypothetical protein